MITTDLLKRINELSLKYKTIGLTEEEVKERAILRKTYLKGFKSNFKKQLDSIEIVD